jgi:hypothetical protein
MKTDSAYNARQKKSKERWRKNRPAHQYQDEYRTTHPDYVEDNRKKQQHRNNKRSEKLLQQSTFEKIVKMDALTQQSPVYEMNSYKMDASVQKIVKMDTLIVQFTATHNVAPN